jgi:hypothetical protein
MGSGFQRYRIKTNGGKSGSGSGSAANSFKKGQTGFDALTIVSDTATFAKDDSISIAVQQGYAYYVVNPALYTWFTLEFATQGTQIVPSDYIYIVKTATGKYAKVWFKSYYSATILSGYVTFQYKYQPDGSKNPAIDAEKTSTFILFSVYSLCLFFHRGSAYQDMLPED